MRLQPRNRGAITLIEMLVATGVSASMLAALMTAAVALQRGYSALDHHVRSQEDQMRAMDYLTRDLQRASTVAWSNQGRMLTITVPDQNAAPIVPVSITELLSLPQNASNLVQGILSYGASPVTISYYIEGRDFVRTEAGVRTSISTTIEEFLGSSSGSLATFQLAFTPKFSRGDPSALRDGTRVRSTVYLRNLNRSR